MKHNMCIVIMRMMERRSVSVLMAEQWKTWELINSDFKRINACCDMLRIPYHFSSPIEAFIGSHIKTLKTQSPFQKTQSTPISYADMEWTQQRNIVARYTPLFQVALDALIH